MLEPPLLAVEELSVAFASQPGSAVRAVSFDVGQGEVFGLVGESGSGKSLTCRAILALLPPGARSTGRILLAGRSLLELPATNGSASTARRSA